MTDLTDFTLIEEPKKLDFKTEQKRRRLSSYLKKHNDNVTIYDIYEKLSTNSISSYYLFLDKFDVDCMNKVACDWRKQTLKDVEKRAISSLQRSMEECAFCPVDYEDLFAKYKNRFIVSPKVKKIEGAAFDKNIQMYLLDTGMYEMCKNLVKNLDNLSSSDRIYGVALLNDLIGKWRVSIEKTSSVSKLKGYDTNLLQKYASNGISVDQNRTVNLKTYVDRNFDSANRTFKSDRRSPSLRSLVGTRSTSNRIMEKTK